MTERLGWIGAGLMGSPMCRHLLDAGHELTVNSRRRESAEALLERGARWAESPAAAAAAADITFTMVGYPADVRAVVLGERGVLEGARPGSLLVEMTTSEPTLAIGIHDAAAARGVQALDAPVSGGQVGAEAGTLVVMVGGEQEAFDRARPLLEVFAKSVALLGGPGSGQHTKAVNQIAIASGMVAISEALMYAARAGLDLDQVIDTLQGGAAASWSLGNYGPRVVRGDLAPGFKIDHFVKDLGIALAEARRMRLSLPGLALAEQLYVAAQARGLGENGTQALAEVIAQLSGAESVADARAT
jgi:3-hydroxyisobutyrate dehydrogenase